MSTIHIGQREVGGDAPVYLVAELSANHGHDKGIALRTIEAAAKAGADAIKLQTYTPDTLTLKSDRPHFVVKTKNAWAGRTLHDLYQEAMTPWEWHAELKACAESLGMACFSTPFDATALEFLEGLDVLAHKVASFELNDLSLVERMARTGKPMVMSTGMASLSDIEAAVAVCREAGNDQIVLLRCVSAYPAKPESMALHSFPVLAAFGTVVGLSDHTRDHTVAIASVTLGAKLIEKHFILDRNVGGPDAFFSLEPSEFSAMVSAVRDVEKALGRPRFGPSEEEVASLAFRRSLFVARDVPAGAVLTCDDVRSVRPGAGMHPRHLAAMLGRVATRALSAGTPFDATMAGDAAETVAVRSTDGAAADAVSWTLSTKQSGVVRTYSDGADVRWSVTLTETGARQREVALSASRTGGSVESAASVLRHAEAAAQQDGVVHLVARAAAGNGVAVTALKLAGYYGFAADPRREGTWICERRIAPYPG